jgi:hypothetical protein
MMNMQDPFPELRRYVNATARNQVYEQDKQKRKLLPHVPQMTIIEWMEVIAALLVLCFALAIHFGLMTL